MGSILVIKLSALGDLVQADGALRDIREHHLTDRITVMTTPAYEEFMIRCPWVDSVLIDPRAARSNPVQMYQLRTRIAAGSYDRVYDLQQVGRTRFYYRWLFPRVPWMGDARGCSCYLRRPDDSCAADHFAQHLTLAGVQVRHTLHSDVSWMADDVTDILAHAGLAAGYIVMFPGASAAHPRKRWPYYRELATRLIAQGRQVVTIPGPDELELCSSLPGTMLVPSRGYYDFFTLAGIARTSDYVVGNDTGPTHIAAHVGARGLALFSGHAAPNRSGIQHSRFKVLESECLAELSADTVCGAVFSELS